MLQNPLSAFDDKRMLVTILEGKLNGSLNFTNHHNNLNYLGKQLFQFAVINTERNAQKLKLQSEKLASLNPLQVLERGYSAAFNLDGTVIKSVDELEEGALFDLRVKDGSIRAKSMGEKAEDR